MTEHDQTTAAAPPAPRQPTPDLGFFAGTPPRDGGQLAAPSTAGGQPSGFGSPAASQFGGAAPSQFGGPAPSQFGGPAPSQFGGPAPSQFGGPAPSPFGGPQATLPSAPPAPAGSGLPGGRWLATGVALVLLLLAFFGGRFGWQQFVAEPVLPDTLGGMPRVDDATSDLMLQGMQDGLADELSAGSEARIGLYTNGTGAGYFLFAVRGGGRPGSDDSGADAFAGWTETKHDGATCMSKPAQVQAGMGVTFCLRGLWRRAVFVMAVSATPPDPATVASVTSEAWDAQ